ncbi:ATP-binding protein [Paludibacterium yongneupense]|uniref:ATP-binding protein n=1 Tax=Paludibacterium yongneupense TaxID=400061 RepID=UPI0003FE6EAA|nr:ATP-binding protein [Paludibacterium yongneupense]
MKKRLLLAILLPIPALAVQWALWRWLSPFVWFLFFPTVFFSARLGGLRGGLCSAILSTLLVWFFFIPPQLSWKFDNPANMYSAGLFLLMGYLFSDSQERLRRERDKTRSALAATRSANDKITQLYEKTMELDEIKTRFFANVSHELRTPLTLIISPLSRRLARPPAAGENRLEDEMMLRSAQQLHHQVSDLLDIAKLEAGSMGMEYTRTDIAALTRLTAMQFDSLAREKAIGYTLDLPPQLEVEIDAPKFERILLNLLSNAFKFIPAGGHIVLRLQQQDSALRLEVEDDGDGIPADLQEAVFERFRQVDGGSEKRFDGTGLGLAIVKEFAELHGGSAHVETAASGGALFVVSLPQLAPAGTRLQDSVAATHAVAPWAGATAGRTQAAKAADAAGPHAPLILVVEDNPDMRAYIVDSLRPNYRVTSARDGGEGLRLAQRHAPDLIVSDIMMPEVGGERMVAELRRIPDLADVPIIILSARIDDALRIRLLENAVQDYLTKPFMMDELLARIATLLAARKRFTDSETRFEATFEQAAMGIALLAPDGRWLRVNPALCSIVGYAWHELMELTFQDITLPDDLDLDLANVRQLLSGAIPSYTLEKRYLRKQGDIVWVNLTVALVRREDGSPDYFISMVENIQARKQAEAALTQSEAELRAAQRMAGIGHWSWDVTTGVHVWSDEIYRIYGRDPAWPPAAYPEVTQYFAADSWARLAAAVEKGLALGIAYECDAEVIRPDGERRWIIARGEATRATDGTILGLHGTVQDISERKRAEEEIRRLNTDLERRVQERTAELSAANLELDSFAYSVSHDLRAPLRAMNGFAQALHEDYGPLLPDEGRQYLDEIAGASRKMGELINGMLVLSRCTRGELRHDPIDISALATHLLQDLVRDTPGRQVEWQVAPGLHARGDVRMIEVVLRNLLDNAWKYTAKTPAPTIRMYAGTLGGLAGFCVEDNGAGFRMEHAEQLYQPFRRLHRQDEFPGIGIGLATVQRILHRHGGEIRAEAAVGAGATFCFSLPGVGTTGDAA